ncbi:MAG: LVIVD repeat-containing protein [Promethearchaeota archaeon]
MICINRNVKNKFIIIIVILFLVIYPNFYYFEDSNNPNINEKISLQSPFTLMFNETFNTTTYMNQSITSTSGWGENFIFLPYQDINNLSFWNYNIDYIKSIKCYGNILFLADNSRGLKLLNITDPMNPVLISQYGGSYNLTTDISIQGEYAYIADGMDGLEIVNITNRSSLNEVNSWSNGYNITNVFISDNLAFLSVEDLGIEILNISNPLSLSRIANWTNYKKSYAVIAEGKYLFVASEDYQLEILDISDIYNIYKVSEVPISYKPYEIQVRNDYLYLANGIGGLEIIDIKNIFSPVILSSYYQSGEIKDVQVEENYAILSCDTYGIDIINILNPFNPRSVFHWDDDENINCVRIYENYLYAGCESNGFQIFELSEYITPKLIYEFAPNINAHNTILKGNQIYVCSIEEDTYDGGLYVFNVSNPFNPVLLGNFTNPLYNFYDVEIVNEICFAATYDTGLISFNISNPADITVLDSIGGYILNLSQSLEIHGDLAFVSNGLVGLDIYNISNPFDLRFITNFASDGIYYDVKIQNNCAFIAKGYTGIEILNISNITNIKSISTYVGSYNNSQRIEFWDNFLLVADRFDGLEILDISNISNPQKISQYVDEFNRTVDLKVLDNLVITADRADGVEIINISNPMNPMEVTSYTDNYNNTMGCDASSRFLYIADAQDGLQIVQYKEHLFNQYEENATAQSLEIDITKAPITNATMIVSGELPVNTSIQIFLSNDNGSSWEPVTNNTLHNFSSTGSELMWRVIISTNDDLVSPKISKITITYFGNNTPPTILNPSEIQELTIWDQQEDFGSFEIDLSLYKNDSEFDSEYLYWSVINLNSSLVSVVQDDLNKDLFRFYSIDNVYGNDEFDLILEDEGGANVSLNITINIYSINDAPIFIESNITIQQEKHFIQIEYEAEDIDNLPSELNYSIYYGSENDWHLIIENYKDTTYTWNTTDIQEGNYYIKIVVSDGLANDTWISSDYYSIRHKRTNPLIEGPLIYIIIISSCVGAGVIIGLGFYAYKRRKSKDLQLIDDIVDEIQDKKSKK